MVGRFLMLMCIMGWSIAAQAAVTAHVDRFNINEGETVNLTIEVTGGDSGEPQTAPLLKDFEILSNSHSSSFSMINGATSSKSVYQLLLRPRHAGALTIPSLKVGAAATDAVLLQVSKARTPRSASGQPSGDIWISMDISPKQVRVQQQAIMTIRVYQAVTLNQAQLTKPKAAHTVVERLGGDATYQKRANGRTWQVTERHYALFPQQSGHIDIDPVQLDGSILAGVSTFGAPFFQTSQPVRVRSNALSMDVSGIPVNWLGASWLPARQVRIEELWPQTGAKFKVGEPITRTLTLRADGLSASQLPEIDPDLPEHLKAYPDKPTLKDAKAADGIHGIRQQKVAIMPMQPGTYILPEIDIEWWNTATEKTEHATLPARIFTVIAASMSDAVPLHPATHTPPSKAVKQALSIPVATPEHTVTSWWPWLTFIVGFGWLLTLALWWAQSRRHGGEKKSKHNDVNHTNLKQAMNAVETACRNHDARACEQALLHMARLQFPGESIHSLARLAQYCNGALQSKVMKLEKSLYASGVSPWRGDALLAAFSKQRFSIQRNTQQDQRNALPKLYPD